MKFGVADYGMNVWEGGCYDMERRLRELKEIGFDGIERIQAADTEDAVRQAALFRACGMDFATCRGPQPTQGIQWTAAFGKDYVWTAADGARSKDPDNLKVFIRRTNYFIDAAEKAGIRVVLHNHLGSVVESQAELDEFMAGCPKAYLLLDVGHLFGAGGDVVGTIHKYADRIEAVHFKDIEIKDPSIGLDKWWERLRFCELGAGNAGLDCEAAARAVKEIGFDKWVFVEHDTHTDTPVKQLKISLDILKKILC